MPFLRVAQLWFEKYRIILFKYKNNVVESEQYVHANISPTENNGGRVRKKMEKKHPFRRNFITIFPEFRCKLCKNMPIF